MKLNLGACDRKFAGFLSVDIVPPADVICDLNGPWPWPDSSVDEGAGLTMCSSTSGIARIKAIAAAVVVRPAAAACHSANNFAIPRPSRT